MVLISGFNVLRYLHVIAISFNSILNYLFWNLFLNVLTFAIV